jgi:putative addiction module killer protein
MYTVLQTEEFRTWLVGLRDGLTRHRLARRLERAQAGNLGDIASVADGVYEMREHFGPGWRMYYVQYDRVLIVMLGGGGKSSQSADIASAVALAARLEG